MVNRAAGIKQAAQRAIAPAEAIRLSVADQALFTNALVKPLKPNLALKRAFARHRKLVHDDSIGST